MIKRVTGRTSTLKLDGVDRLTILAVKPSRCIYLIYKLYA